MKELSVEEKAKCYDEALEKARQLCTYPTSKPFISDLQDLFPELKESEDEKIRQKLIKLVKMSSEVGGFALHKWEADEMLAWLEKQGEQKPADKVEPKFKVGDWVMYCGKPYQITGLHNDTFTLRSCDGSYIINNVKSTNEPISHPWTIQDAKDGDVLACPNDAGDRDVVFIFKNINSDEGWVFCFCASDANGCFCTNNDYVGNSNSTNISPASKEQRDQLERVMTNAGYKWNKEELKLEKI